RAALALSPPLGLPRSELGMRSSDLAGLHSASCRGMKLATALFCGFPLAFESLVTEPANTTTTAGSSFDWSSRGNRLRSLLSQSRRIRAAEFLNGIWRQ